MADGGFCRGTAAGTQRVPHMGGQLPAWEPLGAASRASPAQNCPRRAPLLAPTPPPLCTGTRAAASSWPCGARRTAARRAAPSSAAQRGCWRRAAPRCRLRPRARARVQGWHGGTRTVEDGGTHIERLDSRQHPVSRSSFAVAAAAREQWRMIDEDRDQCFSVYDPTYKDLSLRTSPCAQNAHL